MKNIRIECFNNGSTWLAPTKEEFNIALEKSGLTAEQYAKIITVNKRTVTRWTYGEKPVSYLAWAVLCSYCGHKEIWAKLD